VSPPSRCYAVDATPPPAGIRRKESTAVSEYTFGFVLEQSLGHVTHTRNLQSQLIRDQDVDVHWRPIAWETRGWAARLPIYSTNWTVRAGLRARQAIRELLGAISLDALFIHTQVPAVLSTNLIRRVPTVVSLDATPLQLDELGRAYGHRRGPGWAEQVKRQLNQSCFQAAQHLVTWSEWARQSLVTDYGVPAEKITVIPPGVNLADWARPTRRRPGNGPIRILFVGADFARKGGPTLLEAFRALGRADVELHLVTRQPPPAEPGVVSHLGMEPNSPELRALFQRCDIFCLPTLGDCLPMALAEAGAASLPLVATPVAAIPELVRQGETGLLVAPGDAGALAAALRQLIDDPPRRLRLGDQACVLVRREHDVAQSARRLLDLLKWAADSAYQRGRAA
jgi:glycosyltransferase involved in cell wall biosynthesis